MRRIAIEHFGNRTHSSLAKMRFDICDEPPPLRPPTLPPHPRQRRDPGTEEPGPDGALMIGAVALPLTALDAAAIARIVRRQGAQADRREQLLLAHAKHRFGAIAAEQRKRKGDRQNLVWPDRRVVRIEDVEAAAA